MPSCAVSTCRNNFRSRLSTPFSLHHFPQKNPELQEIWLRRCRRADPVNVVTAVVCSDHFEEDQFEPDNVNMLLNLKQRKILKSDAVPTLKLPGSHSESESKTELRRRRKDRIERRNKEKVPEEESQARFTFKVAHDMALLSQVQALNPFASQASTEGQDPKLDSEVIWEQIATNLSSTRLFPASVTGTVSRERCRTLCFRLSHLHKVEDEKDVIEWAKQPTMLLERLRQMRETPIPFPTLPRKKRRLGRPPGRNCARQGTAACNSAGGEHSSNTPDSVVLGSTPATSISELEEEAFENTNHKNKDFLSQQLLSVEKQVADLVQWAKRQALNQVTVHQLERLRQVIASTATNVALPNPCVRLERVEESKWRRTRTKAKSSTASNDFQPTADVDAAVFAEIKLEVDSPEPEPLPEAEQNFDCGGGGFKDANRERFVQLEHKKLRGRPRIRSPKPPPRRGCIGRPRKHPPKPPGAQRKCRGRPPNPAPLPGPRQCDQCPQICKSLKTLQHHQRTVHRLIEHLHVCATCGKSYPTAGQLTVHERLHTGERPHTCRHCGHAFRLQQTCHKHELKHLQAADPAFRRSQCALCGQLFVAEANMRRHVRLVHEGVRAHVCDLCGKPFKTRDHLKNHKARHERERHLGERMRRRGLYRTVDEGKIRRVGGFSKLAPVSLSVPVAVLETEPGPLNAMNIEATTTTTEPPQPQSSGSLIS